MITFFPQKLIHHVMLSKNKIVQIKLQNIVKLNKYQMKVVFCLDVYEIQYSVKLVWKRLPKKNKVMFFIYFKKLFAPFRSFVTFLKQHDQS